MMKEETKFILFRLRIVGNFPSVFARNSIQRGNDMRTFHEKLEKYAALAVEIGANVQKGQILFISAWKDEIFKGNNRLCQLCVAEVINL
ncbi:hypothetical protein [Bacillus sp. AFS073361]|uniref:hypothetical protein n=1 Tax=Bacillus sp. AFS073361 TaxID=2033511 RepID=UPI0027B942C2|nr:hypothetical protein [Bacillus sp. AFS073361]